MTLTIPSDARWGTATTATPDVTRPEAAIAHERIRLALPGSITHATPTGHRLRRRLGRKCASVLAGASMGLGLTAARIPAASAHVSTAKPAANIGDPVVDDPPGSWPATRMIGSVLDRHG